MFQLTIATFLDLFAGIFHEPYVYLILKLCFTVGSIFYVIGIILWSGFTVNIINDLERMASLDSLTGALNRNGLNKAFDTLIKSESSFYLFVCDLDHTKLVNDTLGHIEGDKFICNASQIMVDAIGKNGDVSRIGGDEFVILVKNFDIFKIEESIFHIKEKISELYPQSNFGISVGYASFPEDGKTFEDLIKIADARMYAEKKKKHTPDQN
jgi:diguanylate cyclase (GGDEF)-like protein